ncbi:MAG: phosphatidylcholine/phosphatidylserine synthase [Planctomycetota bacterium]|nr:phosphatidylcholine/phosphatidylserine synthase [Planctomycetota bacterium]
MMDRAEALSRVRRRARSVPVRRLVPNLLTTVSLCSGLASLHFSLMADWDRALSAIAVAAVFDALDGGAARLLRAQSKFGAVLDSLSDFCSFGVAPAVILHQWMLRDADAPGLAATMTYALCAALRLARFTVAKKTAAGSPLSRFFVGLPTPAAAAVSLIPPMLDASRLIPFRLPEWLVILHVFFVAWLMISRQPCYSLKKLRIPRKAVPVLMVGLGLVVVSAARDAWLTGAALASLYLLSIPVSIAHRARIRRRMAGGQALARPALDGPAEGAPSSAPAQRAQPADSPRIMGAGPTGPHTAALDTPGDR